ncbi:Pollen Ole e 1 allergen/extensin [Quillaja saponaria]|uniref:Pollen Ole e 1 allergen/extensin n=1 Tax=Quillaja saponaria TaxID=32244 RepID=A0AAD7M305_QUISA|nr:Pollen Ole e 1 allergen/extensin [Quillaja saponaria]
MSILSITPTAEKMKETSSLASKKVTVSCANSNGEIIMSREKTTNWFGNYAMRFDGTPDLSNCYALVSGSGQGSMGCGGIAGPAQNLRPVFRMFDMEMDMQWMLCSLSQINPCRIVRSPQPPCLHLCNNAKIFSTPHSSTNS